MEQYQLENLEHFLTRTSMWIHPVNKTSIVSFIHGFEAGTGKTTFTYELKHFLESEYQLFGSAEGWKRQVQLYAEEKETSWDKAFIELGNMILERLKNNSKDDKPKQ